MSASPILQWLPAAVALALALAGSSACSTTSQPTGTGGTGGTSQIDRGTGDDGGPGGLGWSPCPTGFHDECATVAMPLDWNDPSGDTVSVTASRRPATVGPATAQLWLLAGGPGQSGDAYDKIVPALGTALPNFDLFVLEHRGVGLSTRLGCPDQEAQGSTLDTAISTDEWPACLAAVKQTWGEKLKYFTTTADSRDLLRFVELTREAGQSVFIYGASYGTVRALRFLEIAPDIASGVVLDSIASPGVQYISHFDEQFDPVLAELSSLCAKDATCGSKMGADPWARIVAVRDKLKAGACPALKLSPSDFSSFAAELIKYRDVRVHVFPLAYRLDRCSDGDVAVMQHYVTAIVNALTANNGPLNRGSDVLKHNVMLSELWESPDPSVDELRRRCDSVVACPGLVNEVVPTYDTWPRYPKDEFVGKWPTSTVPVLALNGTLDPQTPYESAKAVQTALTAQNQTFVAIEGAAHGAVFGSPVKTPGGLACGEQMTLSFLNNPKAPVDTSCLSDLVPVAFATDPAVTKQLFGIDDAWENGTTTKSRRDRVVDWARVIATLRAGAPQ